jgi:proteic killer suppression protein
MTVSEATPESMIVTLDNHNGLRYHPSMIKSFKDEEAARLFRRQFSRKLPQDIQRIARRKLEILDGAETLQDLRIPPANHLEKLSGDREGQYSIRINDQWRICFEWRESDVYNAEIIDYH